jgi:O-antigen ligase
MSFLLRRFQTEWPVWVCISFFALLPFGRMPEIPLLIFAFSVPFLLWSETHQKRARRVSLLLIPLFLCFWLPMVFSSFDSFLPETSSFKSFAALRYLAAAIGVATLLNKATARWQVLLWCSVILVFWALDGFVQLMFGADLFGISMHPERLNALFVRQYQFYGPTLAMLSPFLLEYARRRWAPWAWVLSFSVILGAVMIAGMRSGWLIMGVVMAVYLLQMFSRENREVRLATMSIPVVAAGVLIAGYLASPLLQQRIEQSLTILDGSQAAVDFASSERVPIFNTALKMYRAHPINGVGVRSFEKAYLEYAEPGDVHVAKNQGKRGEVHAHNVVLEVMADTGSIGLLGLLISSVLMFRYWQLIQPAHRLEAFPFVLVLVLILFPVNSHFAVFGTYLSSLIWIIMGLWAATFPDEA